MPLWHTIQNELEQSQQKESIIELMTNQQPIVEADYSAIDAGSVQETPLAITYLPEDQISDGQNARIHMDEQELDELANSIMVHGILQPLMVMLIPPNFHRVVFGHRRLQAVRLAMKRLYAVGNDARAEQLRLVPVMVREFLNPDKPIDLGLIENTQRVDLDPLEEAKYYKRILDNSKTGRERDIRNLAYSLGKEESYVRQRLQLDELVDTGKNLFRKKVMPYAFAREVCRLKPEDQNKVISLGFSGYQLEKGNLSSKMLTTEYAPGTFKAVKLDKPKEADHSLQWSLPQLKRFINETATKDLTKAPFDKLDKTLLENVPACSECPKRSSVNQGLFPEQAGQDICFDAGCYRRKEKAHLSSKESYAKKRYGEYVKLTDNSFSRSSGEVVWNPKFQIAGQTCGCANPKHGVVTGGSKSGELLWFCGNLGKCDPKCPVYIPGWEETEEKQREIALKSEQLDAEQKEKEAKQLKMGSDLREVYINVLLVTQQVLQPFELAILARRAYDSANQYQSPSVNGLLGWSLSRDTRWDIKEAYLVDKFKSASQEELLKVIRICELVRLCQHNTFQNQLRLIHEFMARLGYTTEEIYREMKSAEVSDEALSYLDNIIKPADESARQGADRYDEDDEIDENAHLDEYDPENDDD
jgi:ParB/RepB/Spo0J family partition protein